MEVLEALIGPPEVLGPIVGKHEKTLYSWRQASKWRCAGDIPSAEYQRAFLAFARGNSIPLTPNHLIYGASRDEIGAILEQIASDREAAA